MESNTSLPFDNFPLSHNGTMLFLTILSFPQTSVYSYYLLLKHPHLSKSKREVRCKLLSPKWNDGKTTLFGLDVHLGSSVRRPRTSNELIFANALLVRNLVCCLSFHLNEPPHKISLSKCWSTKGRPESCPRSSNKLMNLVR